MSKESCGGCCSLVGGSSLVILHLLAMLAGAASSVRGGTNISVSTLDGQQASNTHRRVRQKSTLHAQDAGGQTESLHLSAHHSINIILLQF